MKFIKKNKKILMGIIIGALSIFMAFYTFKLCRCAMNSDSAFIIDYVEEMFKYKTLFPKTWVNTNDFWVYSLIPLIAIFMKLGMGLFVSRQLSVFIQTILLVVLIIEFYKTIQIKKGVFYFLVLLLSGVSAQFMFEMFGDGTYASIIIYILLGLLFFIRYFQTNEIRYPILLFVLLVITCACSLRFPIHIAAPLIVCLMYMAYSDRKIKKQHLICLAAIVLGVLIGYAIYHHLYVTLLINDYSIFLSPCQPRIVNEK